MLTRLYVDDEAEHSLAVRLPRPDSRRLVGGLMEFEWVGLNESQLEQVFKVFDEYSLSCHRLVFEHQRDDNANVPELR